MDAQTLKPAAELANKNQARYPNESEAYRRARNQLLADEIELRRHIERVAEQRRALPLGGEVTRQYKLQGDSGEVSLADLFGDKETLAIYSFMYGPQRKAICPMCTSFMNAWDDKMPAISERIAFVFVARSPIERLIALKAERGWHRMPLYADTHGDFTRDYVSAADEDIPGYNVFMRRDGVIRHFWSSEMGMATADPDQDPRGAPDIDPLWTLLDTTPEGRGKDWYPKLSP